MWYSLGWTLGIVSMLMSGDSLLRGLRHLLNRQLPNELLPTELAAQAVRRGIIDEGNFLDEAASDGYSAEKAAVFIKLTEKLLGLGELADAYYKGIINLDEYMAKAHVAGYKNESAELILKTFQPRLSAGEVMQLKRRGQDGRFGIPDYFDELKSQGYSDERIKSLFYLTQFIPAANDIYNFAAWSVFDKNFVTQFGLDQGKPPSFYQDMAALGVPNDRADDLWASHWQVPSVFIIKELFQTGQISESQLTQMLEVYQIAPNFIPGIIKAFYKPLSESELTNLYKEKLINADELTKRLLNTGISPDDAALKAKEIIAKADNPAAAEKTAKQAVKEQYKDLSVANVEEAYKDGIIDRAATLTYLKDLGESNDVAALHLSLIDYKLVAEQQKTDIQDVTDQVTLGMMSYNEAINRLAELGLTAAQQEKILVKLVKQSKVKTQKPTKSELDEFVKAGLIDQSFYLGELVKLGYSPTYVALFANIIANKINNPQVWPTVQVP